MASRQTVLVVEDNALNLKLVRNILKLNGYEVISAQDAETGIALAGKFRPDLILMDVQLPGMDGLAATARIRNDPELCRIPVVAVTSYAMSGDEKRALDAGCAAYITKPIDTRTIAATIASIIAGGTEADRPSKPEGKELAIAFRPRILIVDDDPMSLRMLQAKLPPEAYECHTASGGRQCLAIAGAILPDLILLDVMMPDMNGYEVTRNLRQNPQTAQIPVVLITALDGQENKMRWLDAGVDEFLTRPVNGFELHARIRSMLKIKAYHEQLFIRNQSDACFLSDCRGADLGVALSPAPTILLVEDDPMDLKLVSHHLAGEPYRLLEAENGQKALLMAEKEAVDLVVLDVMLPGMNGFEICRKLKSDPKTCNIQVMMITSFGDLDNQLAGVETGTDDFLVKPVNQREFLVRTKALLRKKAHIDQICTHYKRALNSAMMDGLTGLYNRAYFSSFIDLEVKRSLRHRHSTALMMIDIDDFKHKNDSFGHVAGDAIIRGVADIVRKNFREIDVVTRYGGDEFAVILPYLDAETAHRVGSRICETVRAHRFPLPSSTAFIDGITISAGIAECPLHADSAEALIVKADTMLYAAKKSGKNRVMVCSGKDDTP